MKTATAYAIAWLRLREDGTVYVGSWGVYSEPPGLITHDIRKTFPVILDQAEGATFGEAKNNVVERITHYARIPGGQKSGQVVCAPVARLVDAGEGQRLGAPVVNKTNQNSTRDALVSALVKRASAAEQRLVQMNGRIPAVKLTEDEARALDHIAGLTADEPASSSSDVRFVLNAAASMFENGSDVASLTRPQEAFRYGLDLVDASNDGLRVMVLVELKDAFGDDWTEWFREPGRAKTEAAAALRRLAGTVQRATDG